MTGPARTLLVGFACAALLAGCTSALPAREWAGQVCDTLGPWRSGIAGLNARAQHELSVARTPDEAKQDLLRLLTDAASATETARAALIAAGAPDVPGGAEIAARFVSSLTAVRDSYRRAASAVRALATADAGSFYDRVTTVLDSLTREYDRGAVDTTSLDSPELRAAFDGLPQCR